MATVRNPLNSVNVQVDGQTDESWAEILAQFADANIYQSWAYGAVRWGERNLSHFVLRKGEECVAAAQLRIARLPLLPFGVAYLRWGPICHRHGQELDPSVVVDMVSRLRAEYCERRGLTLQVISNAYVGEMRGVVFEQALLASDLRPQGTGGGYRTVVVDLAPTAELMRRQLDQKWRNQLNRSEKNGLVLEVSDGREAYGEFVRLYKIMWERKRFETSVDVQEFGRIQEQLSEPQRMRIFLAKRDGEWIGAVVCSLMGDRAIYVLGATNERARELKAAYFLHWQVMMWLKERGARWYDLGGVDPQANPGGFHFKSGFGGTEVRQLPTHTASDGALGDVILKGVAWLRSRRTSVPAPATIIR